MPPPCQLLPGGLASPRILFSASQSTQRSFSTSLALHKNPLQRRRGGDLGSHLPKHVIPRDAVIPEYPYGENLLFKQSNKGLYGEQRIQFGNNVSPKTETKTRRDWKPNVLSKSLYSVALKKRIKLRVASKVLKTMDREGGLDEYLLKQSEARIKELGPTGWALRWTLLQRPEVIARMRAQALEMGISQDIVDQQWPSPEAIARQKGMEKALRRAESTDPEAEAVEATIAQATTEYIHAVKMAKKYQSRKLVDNKEDAFKLAFIWASKRSANKERADLSFHEKIASFPGETEVEKISAYKEWRTGEIEKFGGYSKWRQQLEPENAAAAREARIEEAGGKCAFFKVLRANASKAIEDAESAQYDVSKTDEEKNYMEWALWKARVAIQASNERVYGQSILEATRQAEQEAAEEADVPEESTDAWAQHAQKA